MIKKYPFCLLILILFSCNQNRYPVGHFPDEAVNLDVLNSAKDDINSDIITINHEVELVFSSNRIGSNPNHFNLVEGRLVFYWDRKEGFLSVSEGGNLFDTELRDWVRKTETPFNEKGPYSFQTPEGNRILLFSRDNDQGFYSIHVEPQVSNSSELELQNFRIMDESSNEMYPSFYGADYLKGGNLETQGIPEKLLFSSDRDGQFDVYEMDIPSDQSPVPYLIGETEKNIQKISINSSASDHMPFVYGGMLVFSSDRVGGFGGFDLYYSFKTEQGWTEPENFGPSINSEYDEYRPVVSEHSQFDNRLMIFSSNRPEGLGGFDLYYVGIPKF